MGIKEPILFDLMKTVFVSIKFLVQVAAHCRFGHFNQHFKFNTLMEDLIILTANFMYTSILCISVETIVDRRHMLAANTRMLSPWPHAVRFYTHTFVDTRLYSCLSVSRCILIGRSSLLWHWHCYTLVCFPRSSS